MLIEGVNPLLISRIIWNRGRRVGPGFHPYKTLLMGKKYSCIPKSVMEAFFLEDTWWDPPAVRIYGEHEILVVECKSNAQAERKAKSMNRDLERFLARLTINVRR